MGSRPETAIILGTGLGRLGDELAGRQEIGYRDIPHFPVSTVEGHKGALLIGKLGSKDVLAMQGRFHYYEGYTMQQVTYPVRVMRELGVKTLIVSNASGGLNPGFREGDLMIITDHINLFPKHPLRGQNIPPGPRFPGMGEAYDRRLIRCASRIARELGIDVRHGIYLGTQGPAYETPAESRLFALLGADAVGMSTVPEVIVARHCGMRVFGISVITNLNVAKPSTSAEVSHESVQRAAGNAGQGLAQLVRRLVDEIP